LADFIAVSKHYLGLAKEEPKYDRFQFREKFDYFAVYWGMPIMVFSGLILWFPVYFGGMLPSLGIPLAYIAHADEAILAFLTIITWHIYNTHFKPDTFPMNPAFITGRISEHVMEVEHGDELARIRAKEAAMNAVVPAPDPEVVAPEPDVEAEPSSDEVVSEDNGESDEKNKED
jgi:cytochrome b subunit of formate dehydrogenase